MAFDRLIDTRTNQPVRLFALGQARAQGLVT
jgi:hypothetical protein